MPLKRIVPLAVLSLMFGLLPIQFVHAGQVPGDYTTYYAAIAYSRSTGRFGYSSGFSAEVNARRESLKNCAARDCQVVVVVGNGYAALALGDDRSAYGYGYTKTDEGVDKARRFALEACNERTKRCKVVVSIHSWAG